MTYNCSSSAVCYAAPLEPSLTDACSSTSTVFAFITLLNYFVGSSKKISGSCERVRPVETPNDEYDFVVIGGGAAGSVVAARLSENPEWKVLLLEAGPDESAGMEIPGFTPDFLETDFIWNYTTTNESHACLSTNGSCAWPSAKMLGGNMGVNAMIYLRGNPTDYNKWAEAGNEGWTWEEVEPFFLKAEDNGEIERVGRKHHATGGPLSVERFPYIPPFGNAIMRASEEAGFGINEDLNGDVKVGFSRIQAMNKHGVRRTSARAYLWPNSDRKNLDVSLDSRATKVIMKNKTGVGVEYYKNGEKRTVSATKEIVISGGAVETPHILMLSGIGPREQLGPLGIETIFDAAGVGVNLHDHPCTLISFTVNEPDAFDNDYFAALEYLLYQTGPLSATGGSQVLGVLATNETTPDYPDIGIYIYGYLSNCASGPVGALQSSGKRIVGIAPLYFHPKSRGTITLNSNDPFKYPTIWANYLEEPEDVASMLEGIRIAMALVKTEALSGYNFTMVPVPACDGYQFNSDEYWTCVVRQANYPLYHQGGTCKMGPSSDPLAVVDSRLRVHGIKGLRVVDNSIMPVVPSCNTAAPAVMIGERGAQFMKEDWM